MDVRLDFFLIDSRLGPLAAWVPRSRLVGLQLQSVTNVFLPFGFQVEYAQEFPVQVTDSRVERCPLRALALGFTPRVVLQGFERVKVGMALDELQEEVPAHAVALKRDALAFSRNFTAVLTPLESERTLFQVF